MSDTKDDGSSEEVQWFGPVPGSSRWGWIVPAPADFNKWARRDTLHIAEGVMLLLGFEPFDVNDKRWPTFKAFKDMYETALRSIGLTAEGEWVSWPLLLAWAREKGYPIPEELEEAVNRFHPEAVVQTPPDTTDAKMAELTQERDSLRERVAELEQAVQEALKKAKPLLMKERQSALKLIIGMALKGYQYDPAAARKDATGKISRDLESLGISLDADTVRNWLREAEEVLPSKAKKT